METESVDESTDASIETSSDGGSTVRELNRQLESSNEEDDDGNGTGSAHHDRDNSEWEHQRRRKRSHHDSDSKSVSNKKSRIDTNLAVFTKGSNFDISKEASRQPIEFSRRLGSTIGQEAHHEMR